MLNKLHIVADKNIPFFKGTLDNIAEVEYLSGEDFSPEKIKNADALIIRTRTICNKNLLQGSNVKFIGTATIGYDHIDTDFCKQNNIYWTNAPGCNAPSVAQYIVSALLTLAKKYNFSLSEKTLGIVGVGNVGKEVEKAAKTLGLKILLNDPPRQEKEELPHFVSLNTIAKEADIITFHTPITCKGKYPTYHLFNDDFANLLTKKPIIINAARGEVTETESLLHALDKKIISNCVIDCWENEPNINKTLLESITLATPHIAGYSTDGKATATRMVISSLCSFFNIDSNKITTFEVANPIKECIFTSSTSLDDILYDIVNQSYSIEKESSNFKNCPEKFEVIRNSYPLRREFFAFTANVPQADKKVLQTLKNLGFKTKKQ